MEPDFGFRANDGHCFTHTDKLDISSHVHLCNAFYEELYPLLLMAPDQSPASQGFSPLLMLCIVRLILTFELRPSCLTRCQHHQSSSTCSALWPNEQLAPLSNTLCPQVSAFACVKENTPVSQDPPTPILTCSPSPAFNTSQRFTPLPMTRNHPSKLVMVEVD